MSIGTRPESPATHEALSAVALWRRAQGRLADMAMWGVLMLALAMFTGSDVDGGDRSYPGWFFYSLAVAPIVYEAAMVRLWQGQTLGKSWAGVRVVTRSGQTPGWFSATVRAAATWLFLVIATADPLGAWVQIPALAVLVVVFAVAVFERKRRGLHDLAAGTMVITDDTA